jgi:hypothetical protein
VVVMSETATDGRIGARYDLARTPSILWLWCAPGCLAVAAALLQGRGAISLTVAGALWTLATAWIAIGCAINAKQCGRVHCRIDGVTFSLLSIVGLLDVIRIVNFSWNLYWIAFVVILVASFVPEIFWKRYA